MFDGMMNIYGNLHLLDAIIDARTVVDAQVNYTVPKWKSIFKVGGANLRR